MVAGSFLPLVHVPIIGNWNYWKLDHSLAIICWILSAGALFGIANNNTKVSKIFGILLVVLFVFTLKNFPMVPFCGSAARTEVEHPSLRSWGE